MTSTLAQLGGNINPPGTTTTIQSGLPTLITNIITLATAAAGLLLLFNFIIAGYTYLTAGGDPKKVQNAWAKIWQSIMGLIIIIAAFALIAVAEKVFNVKILQPTITGPGTPN